LEYFSAIWYNLWPFGTVGGFLVYFSRFGIFCTKKNLATLRSADPPPLFTGTFPELSLRE
jgi:hypothetical protein